MSILDIKIYDNELADAAIFHAILAAQGRPDLFTCPVSLEAPAPWGLSDMTPLSMEEALARLTPNARVAWQTPTSLMEVIGA